VRELVQLAERKDDFARLGVAVYALAPQEVADLRGLQEKLGGGVTLLSDPQREAIRAFGVLDKFNLPRASSFLLDREGRIRYRWLTENYRERPTADEILAKASQ
jgi:peroxiredoxin